MYCMFITTSCEMYLINSCMPIKANVKVTNVIIHIFSRMTDRDIQDTNIDIDNIQSSSGHSQYGQPPDDVHQDRVAQLLPGSRPRSATDDYSVTPSGRRVTKPRRHSAPPRRSHQGSDVTHRPHTSMAYANAGCILESPPSELEDENVGPPQPKPFLEECPPSTTQHQDKQVVSVSNKLCGYLTTPANKATPPTSKHIQFSSFTNRTPVNTDFNEPSHARTEPVLQKRGLVNPKTSEKAKSIIKERVMTQNIRKTHLKFKPQNQTTTFRPASLNVKYKHVMDIKLFIQKQNQEALNTRLEEFRKLYPIKRHRNDSSKPSYLISI